MFSSPFFSSPRKMGNISIFKTICKNSQIEKVKQESKILVRS